MSRYNRPKEGTRIYPIRIDTELHSFLCNVYNSEERRELQIGGRGVYCMKIQAFKAASSYAEKAEIDTSVGILHEIKFDEFCALRGAFKPGVSTIHLLMLGLTIVRKMFNHVKTIKLEDASYKTCSNNSTIDYAFVNYLVYGKTWYERILGARLSDEDQRVFDVRAQQFQEKKHGLLWSDVKKLIGGSVPDFITQDMYESAKTWQDFFRPIQKQLGNDEFCMFISPWLFALKELMNYNFHKTYYIDLYSPTLQRIKYKASEYNPKVVGGSRMTRKTKTSDVYTRIPNAVVRQFTDFEI